MNTIDCKRKEREKVYAYIGKFAPYAVGLTIGEITQGPPDMQTARMCVTDIMATLSEYEGQSENSPEYKEDTEWVICRKSLNVD